MTLPQLLNKISSQKASILQKAYSITLHISPKDVTPGLLILLNQLLNNYAGFYWITIHGLPPCLFPNNYNYVVYPRQKDLLYKNILACKPCSLNRQCPGWPNDIHLTLNNIQPVHNRPSEIVMEITGNCNLNCNYCTSATKNTHHVPFNTIKNIINDAWRNKIPAVRFTGGEPLLNPDLPQMLRYAKAKGFYVLLNTNATLLTPDLMQTMSESVDNVLVSLQGFNDSSDQALTHSSFPFHKKIKNISLLRADVPTVRIGTVITPILLDNWKEYSTLIKTLRPAAWELFRPMNSRMPNAHQTTIKQYREIALNILKLKKEGINAKLANALPFCIFTEKIITNAVLLGAHSDDGNSRLVWDVRGFLKPSYFIDQNLGKNIKTAWRHPFLKILRNTSNHPSQCTKCVFFTWCRGGSRAMAFKTYNSYIAPDPLFSGLMKHKNESP